MVEGLARTARDGAAGSPAHEYGHEMGPAACAAATADDEPPEPAPGPVGWTKRYRPVPSAVPSWRQAGLVAMAASALGSAGYRRSRGYNIHASIDCGSGLDFTRYRDCLQRSQVGKTLANQALLDAMKDSRPMGKPSWVFSP